MFPRKKQRFLASLAFGRQVSVLVCPLEHHSPLKNYLLTIFTVYMIVWEFTALLVQGKGHGRIHLKSVYWPLDTIYSKPRKATMVRSCTETLSVQYSAVIFVNVCLRSGLAFAQNAKTWLHSILLIVLIPFLRKSERTCTNYQQVNMPTAFILRTGDIVGHFQIRMCY